MQEYKFEKTIKISFPECDAQNKIKLSNVLRHIGDMGEEHLDALSLPYKRLWNEGFVFLLTRIGMRITRMPCAMEQLRLVTKARASKGVQMMREVSFYDANGSELIFAQTAWVLANPFTHKIYRPRAFPHQIPLEPDHEDCYDLVKGHLRRPENAALLGTRIVRYSDIDCNMHMNNAVYADVIADFLPLKMHSERELCECHIAFVGEVKLGDKMELYGASTDSDSYYIGADRPEKDSCFDAVLKFKAL
ncbi:MAG: thioesterase [Hydrogenoanaerobacterium sp.]